eukprot:Pgem_evm2s14750
MKRTRSTSFKKHHTVSTSNIYNNHSNNKNLTTTKLELDKSKTFSGLSFLNRINHSKYEKKTVYTPLTVSAYIQTEINKLPVNGLVIGKFIKAYLVNSEGIADPQDEQCQALGKLLFEQGYISNHVSNNNPRNKSKSAQGEFQLSKTAIFDIQFDNIKSSLNNKSNISSKNTKNNTNNASVGECNDGAIIEKRTWYTVELEFVKKLHNLALMSSSISATAIPSGKSDSFKMLRSESLPKS